MGSLTKKSQAPTVTYVYPTTAPQTVVEQTVAPVKTEPEIQKEVRTESLLRRSRGRLGTITTSFRGFLDSFNKDNQQRKTLLGE